LLKKSDSQHPFYENKLAGYASRTIFLKLNLQDVPRSHRKTLLNTTFSFEIVKNPHYKTAKLVHFESNCTNLMRFLSAG